MSDFENNSIDPPMTRSKTPLPGNFWQNVSDPSDVISRNAPLINRPAPASMKRKMEQAAHVKDLLKLCKPLSINLECLSQQVIKKMTKKRDHHQQSRRSKKLDRNRWQRGFIDKRRKPKIDINNDKSLDVNKNQNSMEMKPTHIWGCCRMIPFDRNRLKNQKRFSHTNNKELNLEITKQENNIESPIPSTSKLSIDKELELEKKIDTTQSSSDDDDNDDNNDNDNEEENCVCRRVIPYIRKSCYKTMLNLQNDNSTQAGGSKNTDNSTTTTTTTKIGPKISKTKDFHKKKKLIHEELNDNDNKKTDNIETMNDSKKSDDSMEESFNEFHRNKWKLKRKHRTRRISSSDSSSNENNKNENNEEKTRKRRRISSSDSNSDNEKQQKKKKIELNDFANYSRGKTKFIRKLSHLDSNQSSILNYLYRKPKPLKEARIILTRLENMMNDPFVIRWKNRGIKIEKIEEEEEEQEEAETGQLEENYENQRYYLLHEDGTMTSEAIPQEALYQYENFIDNPQDFIGINSFNGQVIDVSKFFNTLPQQEIVNEIYNPLNNNEATIENINPQQQLAYNIENYPKVLLIRLETLVGALDSEYSASEIEILEEKYIDFLLNSNFSYDKQSQSFFNVYKRLQAKRLKEKETAILNSFNDFDDNDDDDDDNRNALAGNQENNEITNNNDDNRSETNDNDENPLVIAFDNDKEVDTIVDDWASDDSVTSIGEKLEEPTKYFQFDSKKENASIEFVTCDSHQENDSTKEPYYISCKFCKNSFRSLHSFSLHKGNCHAKNKKPIKCDYCNSQYKCKRNLNLHVQLVHGLIESNDKNIKTKNTNKTKSLTISKSSLNTKTSPKNINTKIITKKRLPSARNNLRCGVCSVTFETRESLFDHIYQHTERELQDAFNDATIRKKNEEIIRNENEKQATEWANKYAQWKDSILCKNNVSEESSTSGGQNTINSCEEITVCSSGSDDISRKNNDDDNNIEKENSRTTSVIKSTKTIENETTNVVKKVTMCPCHSNDTSTLVNDDMQIEMVLLCEICQVLFRRLDCFEVHYRVNRLCNKDRSSRLPKLFCSSCKILLNSLPEMRRHLEKHAQINRQGHVTFLCNICKVMFFGIGSLFYSHWFNHTKDVNFLASRYSFPKLSIVPCMKLTDKVGNQNKEEYLFVAEHVCRNCKIPFGSEMDLDNHKCSAVEQIVPIQPTKVRVLCLVCNKMFPNKTEYFMHELNLNHMRSTKPEYVTISTNCGTKAYICAQCKTVRKTTDEMKEHWVFHRAWREKFICSYCPKFFDTNINIVEAHCKNCTKDLNPYCKVSFELATFKCQPCNLYFETSQLAKEHNLICLRSQFSTNSESSNKQVASSINLSLSENTTTTSKTSPPILRLTVPSSALSSIATKTKSVNNSESTVVTESPTPILIDGLASKLTDVPSSSKSNTNVESYSFESSPSGKVINFTSKVKSKNGINTDVEVIDILSESSSKSSSSDFSKPSSESVALPKDMPLLSATNTATIQETDKNKSITNVEKKKKKKDKNSNEGKEKEVQAPPKVSVKKNLTMTALNPEFESLLTELEGMEKIPGKVYSKRSKKSPKKVSKETKPKSSKKILKDPLETNEELPLSDAGSESSKSGNASTKSDDLATKSGTNTTDSTLPFEVVLLPHDEKSKDCAKTSSAVGNSSSSSSSSSSSTSSKVDINSNKSVNTATKESTSVTIPDPKDSSSDPNTASIIEEYIEYIMMDDVSDNTTAAKETAESTNSAPPKEISPPVEKVAPTRLRVRSLAELQEIKMHHLCEACGKTFNAENEYITHVKQANCTPQPKQTIPTPANYETSFIQNPVGKSLNTFIPPLLPLSKNISIPRTSVPPNAIVSHQKRHSGLNFGPQTTEINQGTSNMAFNTNIQHRSSAIQLPERTGGNTPQKRPSGAATRIQNLSHPPRHQTITTTRTITPPSMIQHQGLPHTYMHRAPIRMNQPIRPPPPQSQYRPPPDASTSLTCTTCYYTAKNLPEFSAHLLVHYMDTSANDKIHDNQRNNPRQESQQTDPNTSAYQNSQIIASDIYGSSSVTGNSTNTAKRNWQPSTSKYLYVCRICNFQTDNKSIIREHEKRHLEVENNLQKQQLIQSPYQTPQHQQQQQQSQNIVHQGPTTISNKTKDSEKGPIILYSSVSNDVYQCLLCNSFFFSSHDEFVRHLQTVHKQSHKENVHQLPIENICYVCDYCDPPQVFNAECSLRKHMEFLHNHICHMCGQRCTSREILQNHVMSHKLDAQAQ